jgi:hypothetical protein
MVVIDEEVKDNRNEVENEIGEKLMFKRVKKLGSLDVIIQKSDRFFNNVKDLFL